MKDQRVLVTGGAGFIGSHLAGELAKENDVIIIDDLSTGSLENIGDLIEKENVNFIKGSITDYDLLKKSFKDMDFVFHLAALASVPESIKNPIASNSVNINGTLNVLMAARDNMVKKVIFTSSCAVYGDTEVMPVPETSPLNPKSPYAVAKLTGEYYCNVFKDIFNLPVISLRYFNVYGPRQNPISEYAAVVPKFIINVMKDKPPIIFGDGLQTRDFVFVKDVVRANILAAQRKESGGFNIGSGISTSIVGLAETIIRVFGKDIEPVHKEARDGEIRNSRADISKAHAIGYKPEYSLEEGLKETIRAFDRPNTGFFG
jgi:UDP-glucose 4-epimerase